MLRAVEYLYAEIVFQLPDLHAQCGLRHETFFRSRGKMPVIVDRHDVFQLYQCDHDTNIELIYLTIKIIDLTYIQSVSTFAKKTSKP